MHSCSHYRYTFHTSWHFAIPMPPLCSITESVLLFANPHLRATFDRTSPGITSLSSSWAGHDVFTEALAKPVQLEREDSDGTTYSSSDGAPVGGLKVTVNANTSTICNVSIAGIVDHAASPLVSEIWTVSLASTSRRLTLHIAGRTLRDGTVRSVRHGLYWRAKSINALFDRGVVQMKNAAPLSDFFGSRDAVSRIYALGGGTGMDATFATAHNVTSVILSSSSGRPYWSGVQRVRIGDYGQLGVWDGGWRGKPLQHAALGMSWSDEIALAPNDKNFPPPPDDEVGMTQLSGDDLEAIHTASYGSAVGCLCTYDNEVVTGQRVAQVATTIARPDRGYAGTYNYFDPDNYLTMSALIYSGDPYLLQQARLVIERSGAFLLPNGQLPHHFVGAKPTYSALSGATQTGPNTFWTLSALSYARNAGDLAWLRAYMPTLRRAASFCFDLIDPSTSLLRAPGPLMIDVFLRSNYTADSNAMIVGFLGEFAEAEAALGNATGAATLRDVAMRVSHAMNLRLWATAARGADRSGPE